VSPESLFFVSQDVLENIGSLGVCPRVGEKSRDKMFGQVFAGRKGKLGLQMVMDREIPYTRKSHDGQHMMYSS